MRCGVFRGLLAGACLAWLAGCQTAAKQGEGLDAKASAQPADVSNPEGTGTAQLEQQLLGSDPNDDLSIGKKYFRQGSFGLAERHFRKAVELHPQDAESWVGLAAAYDRLRRFDLADRAYQNAIKVAGETPEIMNNHGFSYILRGDYPRARSILLAAQARAPDNPYIRNNLQLLAESARKRKAVN